MNDTTHPTNPTAVFDAPKPDYGPELSFYHANAKNTGVAITFRVEPATANLDGAVYFSIAKQKSVGNLNAQGPERFASFDWANKTTVKLGFLEVAEMMMVFGGQASVLTHAGKEGFFHNSPSATTSVSLKRAEDPNRPGFILGVGRTPKADPNARQFYSFAFWPSEAFALRAALMAEWKAYAEARGMALAETGSEHRFTVVSADGEETVAVLNPEGAIPCETIQKFLDDFLSRHPEAGIDFIHGEGSLRALAAKPDTVGFLLPDIDKGSFFRDVEKLGVLPRKTFSMGEADEKRFYMEAKKI